MNPNHDRNDADAAANRPMSVSEIKDSYAEYADRMRRFEWIDRIVVGRYRRDRFGDVEGRVLDVACGTGTNFRYLPDTVDLVGIDVSPEMLANAEDHLAELAIEGSLREMDAQELEFADDSFDAVISALSTCTFPDPVAALREMGRVCKPEGTIRLVEHGHSDVRPIARYQEWRADAHYAETGCRWTQEPRELVSEAGLEVRDTTTALFGTITTFELAPNRCERR
ncbi:class I SAM-dependent methyltransferase [Candidatus Halobonum tyrrellensis]|uniref:Methylase involved in ubiquinone/menaquinone biosynthesis n=1 Tax=Candidatus Halobonum tyrrellensis G22 TaxID=1324957 RepID=V4HPC1_9EURY|nr:class I SAM-dependent methyltransferase [Candidatus Halobonum tyrrellensis]ESP89774.1 methylase involved in ubiquinone/menaquinone biosynthesis [Candidatus Halobonum tyrrellensis G22]